MNLSSFQTWGLRQLLGTKRGRVVIEILSGPTGSLIDMLLQGKLTLALGQIDMAVAHFKELIDKAKAL